MSAPIGLGTPKPLVRLRSVIRITIAAGLPLRLWSLLAAATARSAIALLTAPAALLCAAVRCVAALVVIAFPGKRERRFQEKHTHEHLQSGLEDRFRIRNVV
jgi:hypothetical protein